MIVPFVTADAERLAPFLSRHQWFCEIGGHILFKATDDGDNPLHRIIQCAGCELVQTSDSGIYEAWNQAMDTLAGKALPEGSYVTFLGLDDTLCDQYCLAVARLSLTGDSPDFYFGNAEHRLRGHIRHQTTPIHPKLFGQNHFLFDIAHPGLMNKWETIRNVRFDTRYRLAADFDFYIGITRNRKVSYQKIPEIQASIGAEGMSNSLAALEIYPREWSQISSRRKVELDVPRLKIALFRIIARFPLAFNSLRRAAWLIRGMQAIHKSR